MQVVLIQFLLSIYKFQLPIHHFIHCVVINLIMIVSRLVTLYFRVRVSTLKSDLENDIVRLHYLNSTLDHNLNASAILEMPLGSKYLKIHSKF